MGRQQSYLPSVAARANTPTVSRTMLQILELVDRLPPREKAEVWSDLAERAAESKTAEELGVAGCSAEDDEGVPDNHPFFRVMGEIEHERRGYSGPEAPELR